MTVYGLVLSSDATINVTVRANPRPRVEWNIDGVKISQGDRNGRYEAAEAHDLGHGVYNVTLTISDLTVEDTKKPYYLRASNALGVQDYTVRISSSLAAASTGMNVGTIIGIIAAIAILLIVIIVVVFARTTGRWCFAGKSSFV